MRFALLALVVLIAQPLRAVVLKPLSLDELSAQAEIVVRGNVISKTCERDSAGRIYTRVELQLSEIWRGSIPAGRLYVVHGGGVLGEERVVVSGQVQYRIGEDVVAFLVRNDRGEAVTLAMAQGKFSVLKDDTTGEVHVCNGILGAEHNSRSPLSENGRLNLATLKSKIRGAKL